MSRHEEEIEGEGRGDWTDEYQGLAKDALKRAVIRNHKMSVISDEIHRCERRLVYLRQDIARLRREGEPQLPLEDQPTFAPDWPPHRQSIEGGQ